MRTIWDFRVDDRTLHSPHRTIDGNLMSRSIWRAACMRIPSCLRRMLQRFAKRSCAIETLLPTRAGC